MAEVISMAESTIHPVATCECGCQQWLILVDGFQDQWEKIIGIKCSNCETVIDFVRADKLVTEE
jgi:hypothetical protein